MFLSPHKFVGGPGTPGVLVAKRALFVNRVPAVPGGGTIRFVIPAGTRTTPTRRSARRAVRRRSSSRSARGSSFALKETVGARRSGGGRGTSSGARWRRGARTRRSRSSAIRSSSGSAIVSLGSATRAGCCTRNFVAAVLNDLFGIQARSGCFCAGPYIHRLYPIDEGWSAAMEAEVARARRARSSRSSASASTTSSVRPSFEYIVDAVAPARERGLEAAAALRVRSGHGALAAPQRAAGAGAEPSRTVATGDAVRDAGDRARERPRRLPARGPQDPASSSRRPAAPRAPAVAGVRARSLVPVPRRCARPAASRQGTRLQSAPIIDGVGDAVALHAVRPTQAVGRDRERSLLDAYAAPWPTGPSASSAASPASARRRSGAPGWRVADGRLRCSSRGRPRRRRRSRSAGWSTCSSTARRRGRARRRRRRSSAAARSSTALRRSRPRAGRGRDRRCAVARRGVGARAPLRAAAPGGRADRPARRGALGAGEDDRLAVAAILLPGRVETSSRAARPRRAAAVLRRGQAISRPVCGGSTRSRAATRCTPSSSRAAPRARTDPPRPRLPTSLRAAIAARLAPLPPEPLPLLETVAALGSTSLKELGSHPARPRSRRRSRRRSGRAAGGRRGPPGPLRASPHRLGRVRPHEPDSSGERCTRAWRRWRGTPTSGRGTSPSPPTSRTPRSPQLLEAAAGRAGRCGAADLAAEFMGHACG